MVCLFWLWLFGFWAFLESSQSDFVNLFLRIQDKSVLVVSGSIARRGKSTLSWTVNNLYRSIDTYVKDCITLGVEINEVDPSMKIMPFVSDELDEKPTDDEKTKVINIGKFYKNQEKFREILR